MRPRRLEGERLSIARREFAILMKQGIIRPTDSNWAAPRHTVPKKDTSDRRPCGDYGALKDCTIFAFYPLPLT